MTLTALPTLARYKADMATINTQLQQAICTQQRRQLQCLKDWHL
jgi:hypothetical protein